MGILCTAVTCAKVLSRKKLCVVVHMFDEMLDGPDARGREPYRSLLSWLDDQDFTKLRKQSVQAEDLFRRIGITFNVYGDEDGE